jgi:hypothetical protein
MLSDADRGAEIGAYSRWTVVGAAWSRSRMVQHERVLGGVRIIEGRDDEPRIRRFAALDPSGPRVIDVAHFDLDEDDT